MGGWVVGGIETKAKTLRFYFSSELQHFYFPWELQHFYFSRELQRLILELQRLIWCTVGIRLKPKT